MNFDKESVDSAHPGMIRLLAGGVVVLSLSWLVLAARLVPAEEGHGTHMQLGLQPCSWLARGYGPCPTCGMTTAFALAAHGRIGQAFVTQPAGALLALLVAMAVWAGGYTLITASPAVRGLKRLAVFRTAWAVGAVVLLSWAYKWFVG